MCVLFKCRVFQWLSDFHGHQGQVQGHAVELGRDPQSDEGNSHCHAPQGQGLEYSSVSLTTLPWQCQASCR